MIIHFLYRIKSWGVIMKSLIKKLKINSKSILINLILSYILVLFVALSIYFLAYNASKGMLKKEVENNYRASLSQLKLTVDNRLSDMENIGTELYVNKRLQSLMYQSNSDGRGYDNYDSYDIVNIITQMHSWKLVNNFIENINVYLPNFDLVICEYSTYAYDNWYKMYFKSIKGMEKKDFRKYLEEYHVKKYLPITTVNYNKQDNRILYLHSLSVGANKVPKGTLVINIKEDFIKNLLNKYSFTSKKGSAFIIDSGGNFIFGEDNLELSGKINYEECISRQKELISIKMDNKKYLAVVEKSDVTDWVYGFVLPDSVFFDRLNVLSTISVVSIVFCLFIATIIIYYFTRKNYSPIDAIVKLFAKVDNSAAKSDKNEYKYIRNVASKIIIEREEIYKKLDINKLELKNHFLSKLLRGRIYDENIFTELCKEHDVNFINRRFAVIIIKPMITEENNLKTISHDILQFVIKSSFEAEANIKFKGYVVEIDKKSACIVNIDDIEGAHEELYRIANEAKKAATTESHTELFISIGNIHENFTGIAESFNEANETMEYQNIMGDIEVLDYKTINNYSDAFIVEDFENNKKIRKFIESGDFASAKLALNNVFNNNLNSKRNTIPLYEIKAKIYGLINLILESMYDLTAKYDYDFFKNINPEKKILKCDNISRLHKEMENILDYAENYVKQKEKAKNNNLIDEIINFVNENYADNNLNVSMIAEQFGVTVPYISKFFKKKLDKGLLDFIHSVRIEHAKELLKKGNIAIKDVAERTGYYNTVSFIRVFKKFEGSSPGKFR